MLPQKLKTLFGGKKTYDVYTTISSSSRTVLKNGGRKFAQTADGTKFMVEKAQVSPYGFVVYKSIDGGVNWTVWRSQLTMNSAFADVSIATFENYVYVLALADGIIASLYWGTSAAYSGYSQVCNSDNNAVECCAIACGTDGSIHCAFTGKTGALPNSFNIRYRKGTNSGGTISWGTLSTITAQNTAGRNLIDISICINSLGNPVISHVYTNTSPLYYIYVIYWNGSSWSMVYADGALEDAYSKSSTCIIKAPNGRLYVVWDGRDSGGSYYIRVSWSDNNSATWTTGTKLYVGEDPTITFDADGNPHIIYSKGGTLYRTYSTNNGSSWVAEINTGYTGFYCHAPIVYGIKFTEPLIVFSYSSYVRFSGMWEE